MTKKFTSLLRFYRLFPALLLLGTISACNTDTITDNGVYTEHPPVSGTYHLTMMQSNDPSNLNDRSNTAVNLLDELDCLYVTLELLEDGTMKSRYVDLSMSKDTDGNYQFNCGPERSSEGTWSRQANSLTMDNITFLIKENQLIDARNRDTELIDLLVFTRAD